LWPDAIIWEIHTPMGVAIVDIHPIMLHRMVPAGEADTGTIMTAPNTNGTMEADGAIILQGRRK
jgi:hypothetical protein